MPKTSTIKPDDRAFVGGLEEFPSGASRIPPEVMARPTYKLILNNKMYWESIHAGMFPPSHPYPKATDWVSPQTIALCKIDAPSKSILIDGNLVSTNCSMVNGRIVWPCQAREVLCGGHRGGGKSALGIVWLGSGNQELPVSNPMHQSFFNHRNYRAIVFRRNATDLKDWHDKFEAFWQVLKVKPHGDPPYFEFSSGARVYTNHLEDESSYEKYKGWEFQRILIEELTHIPSKDLYMKVLGSLRSTSSELEPQLMATTNPDGPGSGWVRDRFVQTYGNNQLIPWGKVMVHPVTKRTRVFIAAKLEDNPFLDADTKTDTDGSLIPGTYRGTLMEQPYHIRRAWLYGDWDAMRGAAFPDFRPQGPKPGDIQPERARHVYPAGSIDLKPWWTRWMSMDAGYSHNTAVYWCCLTDQGQIVVYREFIINSVSYFDQGTEIAKASLDDLRALPSHTMNMVLSPDVMRYTDEANTIGSQIAHGMEVILGAGSTFLMQYTLEEKELQRTNPDAAWHSRQLRWDSMSQNTAISITPASNDRIAGWNYLRGLMRWWKVAMPSYSEVEASTIYRRLGEGAMDDYIRQASERKRAAEEVLPKLIILDCCPKLIRGLRDAVCDEAPREEDLPKKHWEYADAVDSCRYAMMAHRDLIAAQPKAYWIADRMNRAKKELGVTDPTLLAQMAVIADGEYAKENGVYDMRPMRARRACIPDPRTMWGARWPQVTQ